MAINKDDLSANPQKYLKKGAEGGQRGQTLLDQWELSLCPGDDTIEPQ